MRRYYTKSEILYGFSYLLLFLFSIRFLNKNNTFLLLYAGLGILLGAVHRSLTLSKECVILLLYGLFYYYTKIYWGASDNLTALITCALGAPLMYNAGQQLIRFASEKEAYYKKICWIVAIGMFLFAILSYLKNGVLYNYEYGKDLRQVPDLWVGNASLWQATNINGYCVFAVIVSMVACFQKVRGTRLITALILFVGSVYLSLVTASRTNLFLIVLVILCYIVLTLLLKKNIRYVSRRNAIEKVILIVIGLLVAQVIILNLDTVLYYLPLEAFTERLSNRQLSISGDGRWQMWASVVQEIPTHFWGNITSVHLAHNIFLDVARESGVIPMVLLLIFTVMVLNSAWRLLWNEYYSLQLRVLNGVLIFSLVASFFIEPVMNAKPFVFIAFCMVCGMQRELLNNHNGEEIIYE